MTSPPLNVYENYKQLKRSLKNTERACQWALDNQEMSLTLRAHIEEMILEINEALSKIKLNTKEM